DATRLQGGGVSAKEAGILQHEIGTLAKRQSVLEDAELEVMERREDAETRLARHRAVAEQIEVELDGLGRRRDSTFAEIDEKVRAEQADRYRYAADVPEPLLALYERIRAQSGGTGAAMLRARRCEGCRIELAGNELALVRKAAPDEVVRCEECRRILVRTAESGL
ncbi:MAG: zinc ribbon domain-containing protein, partial [Mycobacteriales bacterium]